MITVFLPCRKGSERIKNKNTRKFCNFNHGLLELKINQLLKSHHIDKILISTNDNEILNYLINLNIVKSP